MQHIEIEFFIFLVYILYKVIIWFQRRRHFIYRYKSLQANGKLSNANIIIVSKFPTLGVVTLPTFAVEVHLSITL